jgi:hypothetical protein
MNDTPLSDSTLKAFMQIQAESHKNEPREAPLAPSQRVIPRNNETLRSDWTVAALQQRFAALEQRIAALEHREAEQRRKESVEAADVTPKQEKPCQKDIFPNSSTLVAFSQIGDERPPKEQDRFTEPKIKRKREEVAGRANGQPVQGDEAEIVLRDVQERLQGKRNEGRPIRNDETARAGTPRKMSGGFISFLLIAFIAGAIGFGAALYAVPIEKAAHFRALIKDRLAWKIK